MAQLFKPSANSLAKTSILLAGLGAVGAFYGGSTISRSPWNTKANVALNQPVPFSHKHHSIELAIDCRFCHTGVETSPNASVPSVETCMMCHSQVWTNSPLLKPVRDSYKDGTPIAFFDGEVGWNQVNKLPEFVYFDHSIHINRGINCSHCHGDIQEQAITAKGQAFSMSYCLECHSNPEKYLYEDKDKPSQSPKDKVFDLYRKVQAGDVLTQREQATLTGIGGRSFEGWGYRFQPTAEDIKAGEELVKKYKVKKSQLTDCWVCHR